MSFFLSLFRHADESKLKADTGNGHGPSKGTRMKQVGKKEKEQQAPYFKPMAHVQFKFWITISQFQSFLSI